MRREERKAEKAAQKAKKQANAEPFFNFGRITPFAKTLVIAFTLVHIPLHFLLDDAQRLQIFYHFGFVPATFTGGFEWHWAAIVSPLTHALIHGGLMHITFNAVMGLALGIFFERNFGTRTTAIFFALCTLAGALFYFAFAPQTTTPMIGASGGISGLFGALIYITLTQNTHHPVTQRFGKRGPWPVLIVWGLIIVIPGLFMGGQLAWQAHLGGYVAGLGLLIAMQKGKIKL